MCSQITLGNFYQLGNDIDGEAEWDNSGSSVSLSADGSIVAIGAFGNAGNAGNGNSSGHVRLYEWDGSSWNQLGSDIDGEASGDYSGSSVSLSADGTVVAIGAPNNDGNGGNFSIPGHVRLYEWDGSSWNQLGSDIDGEAEYDYSGSSVSLSADGFVVAIGAYGNDGNGSESGHVRVYMQSSDSDSDGLSNYHERNIYSTDPNDADSDDDGLNDGDEINTYSTDPNDADSDNDGFNDGDEVSLSLNPNISNVDIITHIEQNMRDLRIGSQTFDVSNGTATIRMYVDESSDLTSTWSNTKHVLELDIPADADTKFYRFRMD